MENGCDRRWHWRNNPCPISGTSISEWKNCISPGFQHYDWHENELRIPQFCFVFQMLHETFTCRVVINDCNLMALIRMQNSEIYFDQCFIFPQWCWSAGIQLQFRGYVLASNDGIDLYRCFSIRFSNIICLPRSNSSYWRHINFCIRFLWTYTSRWKR